MFIEKQCTVGRHVHQLKVVRWSNMFIEKQCTVGRQVHKIKVVLWSNMFIGKKWSEGSQCSLVNSGPWVQHLGQHCSVDPTCWSTVIRAQVSGP